jgi:hypothetical protein
LLCSPHKQPEKGSPFQLGSRASVLNDVGKPAVVLDVACKAPAQPFEALFRSINQLLLDAATEEHAFCSAFFDGDGSVPKDVLAKTVALHIEVIDEYITNTFDVIGVFLLICIVKEHEAVMVRRRIDSLDHFLARLTVRLWQRLKALCDLNIESMRAVGGGGGSTAMHCHFVTKRYADLSSSLAWLNLKYSDARLKAQLAHFRNEMEKVLHRIAAELKEEKQRKICLINNYDAILAVFEERGVSKSDDQVCFEERLGTEAAAYVAIELDEHYGKLIRYVREAEPLAAKDGGRNLSQMQLPMLNMLVEDFNQNWKRDIQKMNDNVMAHFSNFRNGMEILRQASDNMQRTTSRNVHRATSQLNAGRLSPNPALSERDGTPPNHPLSAGCFTPPQLPSLGSCTRFAARVCGACRC